MPQTIITQTVPNRLRIPPQSLDAEVALLGSIMLRPEALYDITEIINQDSFYSEKHKIIFESMMELFVKRSPIDLLSVSNKLKEKGWLDQIGGNTYLTEIVNSVPSSSNIVYYALLVQKKYMMRRLIEASDHISQIGYDENKELEEMLDNAEKKLFEVTNFNTSHKFIPIKDELHEAWERLDHLHKKDGGNGMRGVPTGFKDIDNKLSGLQKSDLIILAGRPSTGKTSLALDIARQAAVEHNVQVGIFSLEMSSQQLVDRMLAAQSNVDAWKMRTGKLSVENDFTQIRTALDKLSRAPIYIDDQPGNNILKMRSIARRLKSEKGLGLIVVDYLQLMVPTSTKSDNVVQQVTEISHSLKNLARELDVPVLALSQLSRAVEQRGGRPRLSDLRDSGSIEQDADIVMFIHREDKYKEESEKTNIAEILIEKHRNGETGRVELFFDEKKATFQSMDKSNYGGTEKQFSDF
jgi:replicative DNA helicase